MKTKESVENMGFEVIYGDPHLQAAQVVVNRLFFPVFRRRASGEASLYKGAVDNSFVIAKSY